MWGVRAPWRLAPRRWLGFTLKVAGFFCDGERCCRFASLSNRAIIIATANNRFSLFLGKVTA
jgi:hypothetical protein